jgi:hypothetical protein
MWSEIAGGQLTMNIDDPQKALEAQLAAEERSEGPLIRYIPGMAKVLGALPVGLSAKLLANGAGWLIGRAREERRNAIADVLAEELTWVKARLQEITDDHARFMENEFRDLVLDAFEKAEQTRSRERIERIGRIVANAAVSGPQTPTDITEELSRIAMSLDDADVIVLSELVRGQRTEFSKSLATVPAEAVNNYWRTGDVAIADKPVQQILPSPLQTAARLSGVALKLQIPEGELHARCAKLQAFGLTVQVNRNEIKNPPGTLPYAILGRAIDFVDAIRSLAPKE